MDTDMRRVQEAGDALRGIVARIEQDVARVGQEVREVDRNMGGHQTRLEADIRAEVEKWAVKVGLPYTACITRPLGSRTEAGQNGWNNWRKATANSPTWFPS